MPRREAALGGVESTGVEVVESAIDEVLGQAVADLALFFIGTFKRRASAWGGCGGPEDHAMFDALRSRWHRGG